MLPADLGLPQVLGQVAVLLLAGLQQGAKLVQGLGVPPVTGGLNQGEQQHQQPEYPHLRGQKQEGNLRELEGELGHMGRCEQHHPAEGQQHDEGHKACHKPPPAGQIVQGVLNLLLQLVGVRLCLGGVGLLAGQEGL